MDMLVDSNVILDIVTEDRRWFAWSSETLSLYAETHVLLINPIIYAEVSIGFERIEEVEEALPASSFRRDSNSMGSGLPCWKVFSPVPLPGRNKAFRSSRFFHWGTCLDYGHPVY